MAKPQAQRQNQKRPPQQQAAAAKRILRIGIVLGGGIIEERLCRKRETITLGQSAKNSFSIPIEDLPKSFPIFAYENGQYYLHFTDNMDGRISAGGNLQTLAQIKQSGAQKRGNEWVVPLDEHSRGKVSVGSMDLLFQFVTAPPLQPRPRLPASVRGSLADRIEPRLAIILTLSVIAHFSVALWAYTRDQVVERPVDKIARTFQVGEYEPPPPPPEPVEVPVDEGDETEEAGGSDTKQPEPNKKPPSNNEPSGGDDGSDNSDNNDDSGSPDDAAIEEAIADTAIIAVLTGTGGEGGLFSQMSGTDQGASLDNSIAHAKGKATTTTGSGSGRRQRGQNTGKIGKGKGGGVSGPGPGTGPGKKEEEKITSRIKVGKADDLSLSDLDPASVVKRIRGKYLAGIKRCHQRVLKIDPKAQGKVTIRFTVGPTGRVTKARVKGFDPAVDACIKGQASKWRFSAPKDDGKPTSADFEFPMILKPGA